MHNCDKCIQIPLETNVRMKSEHWLPNHTCGMWHQLYNQIQGTASGSNMCTLSFDLKLESIISPHIRIAGLMVNTFLKEPDLHSWKFLKDSQKRPWLPCMSFAALLSYYVERKKLYFCTFVIAVKSFLSNKSQYNFGNHVLFFTFSFK